VSGGIELEPDPRRLRIARNLRRVGIVALLALLGLALAGVFDPSDGEVSAAGGGVDLKVSYPEQVRGGLEAPLEVEVTREGGFSGPVEISITRDWLALFDLGSIDPQPDSETGDDENLIWSFEPPPGDRLDVTVSLTLRPAVRTGEEARVTVLDGDAELAAAEFETGVIP
jgi:hypothetical protein